MTRFQLAHWAAITSITRRLRSNGLVWNIGPTIQAASGFFEAAKDIVHDLLDQADFLIAQLLELALTALLGQSAVVLPDEHDQVLSEPVRHFDRIHDAADGFVVTAQVVDLARQIVLDRAPDARIQELRLRRAVEITVQIGGLVEDLDIALGRRSPRR